ncbi:MAG: alanine racemase [Phycisphaerales bacterium]
MPLTPDRNLVRFAFHPDAVEHNLRAIRSLASADGAAPSPQSPALCAIIKADGYGLGAARLIPPIERAGAEFVGVFSIEEARAVAPLVAAPVLVLGPAWDLDPADHALGAALHDARLHIVVHGHAHLQHLARWSEHNLPEHARALPLHIEVDTGLGRGGASPQEARELVATILATPTLRLAGVMTHFADASLPGGRAGDQQRLFANWIASVIDQLPEHCLIHQASTTTLFAQAGRPIDLVRVGLGLFGCPGVSDPDPRTLATLRGAVSLHGRIVLVRDLPPGSPVGYAGTFVTARPTRLALVPVGYSHGFPRLNDGATAVVLAPDGTPRTAPIIGRIGMDQLALDATDIPEPALGTPGNAPWVRLIGQDTSAPTSLQRVAAAGGMIPHELLCRLGSALRPEVVRGGSAAPA